MSIQYFKKERGGVNPVGWVQPHILKDPIKGGFTRKYEPVNVADTMYMYQQDPTRINENIQLFARGQNPMVAVSYQNAGGASTNSSLGNAQVSNPYKVEVVRPPITPIEALQPISAPRMHQNYTITTNPGIFPQSVAGEYDKQQVRLMTQTYTSPGGYTRTNINSTLFDDNAIRNSKLSKVMTELLKGQMQAQYSYNLDNIRDMSTKQVRETKDLLPIAATTPLSFTDIVVFDPRTNTNVQVEANIREKNAIAVTAQASAPIYFNTNDGQTIKLKDYEYKVVQAPYGNTQMVIYVRQPEITLQRNTPLYAAQATLSNAGKDYGAFRAQADLLRLESIMPLVSATSSIKLDGYNERNAIDADAMQLEWQGPRVTATSSVTLTNQGYNEQQWRNGRVAPSDKVATFGEWGNDRTTRANPLIRGLAA